MHVLVQADLACARSFTEHLGCIDYDCGCRKMIDSGDYFLCTYHQGKDDGAWSIDPEQASMTGGVLTGDDVLRQRVQMGATLTEVDLDTLDEVLRQAEVCRETLGRLVQDCQYIGPSHRDADGMTEIRYEGATVLTREQWALVELFMGDL